MAECYKVTTFCGKNFIVKSIDPGSVEIECLSTGHKEVVDEPYPWFARHNMKIDQIRAHEPETV